jgi:YggT family protein
MPSIASILWTILWLYSALMWIRFIAEWVRQVAPQWRPNGIVLLIAETAFTATDPPINFVRRFVKPLRIGAVAIDFAWTIVLFAVYLAMSFVR